MTDDAAFLRDYLAKLQTRYATLRELDPDDFHAEEGPPQTPPEAERAARIAERYGQDGNLFRSLRPTGPDFDWTEYWAMLSGLERQIDAIPPLIHRIEEEARKPLDPAEAIRQAEAALMDETDRRILAIAGNGFPADQRMRDIALLDKRFLGYSAPKWAQLLHVTDAAIRQTDFWKEIQRAKKAHD